MFLLEIIIKVNVYEWKENPYAGINIFTVQSMMNPGETRPEPGNVGFVAPESEVSSLLIFLLSFLTLLPIYFLALLLISS